VNDEPVVVVVDDERDLADLYTTWLEGECEVRTAYDGRTALDLVDEDVDVALIDRLMPDMSGDELLAAIREAGYDCQIAMVTAVEPDFDIIEMGFDSYLVKPALQEELCGTVERLMTRGAYDQQVRELYALSSKRAVLVTEKDQRELSNNPAFRRLSQRLSTLRHRMDRTATELDARDFEMTLRRLAADNA
jgi:DNA-binding response OmpR family regulator